MSHFIHIAVVDILEISVLWIFVFGVHYTYVYGIVNFIQHTDRSGGGYFYTGSQDNRGVSTFSVIVENFTFGNLC